MSASFTPESTANGLKPTFAELVGLRVMAKRRLPARIGRYSSGSSTSNLRGRGMEYAESREYVAGDDARHIDWRVTARTGKAHTKLFHPERERLTVVLVDTAASLFFGTKVRFKSVQAARAAAIAIWVAILDGDKISALRGSRKDPVIRPTSGFKGGLQIMQSLEKWYQGVPTEDAGLAYGLERAQRLLKVGSRLLVVADAQSVLTIPEEQWSAVASRCEVSVVLLADPLELTPPKALLPFLVKQQRVELDLASGNQRKHWQQQFKTPMEQAAARLKQRGIRSCSLLSNDESDAWRSEVWSRTPATTS